MMGAAVKRLALLTGKEWRDLKAQKIFIIVTAFAPFMLFFIFYLIWAADIRIPIEVTNSAGPSGHKLVMAMQEIKTPSGLPYIQVIEQNPSILGERHPGDYLVLLEIPKDFGRDKNGVKVYEPTAHYGAEQENSVKNSINRLHMAETKFLADNCYGFNPIKLKEINRYAEDIPTRQFMAVGMVAFAFLIAGIIFGGIFIAREYEGNTVKLIRVSSASRLLLFISKGIPAIVLTSGTGAIFTVVAAGILTGAWPKDPVVFILTAVLISATGVILGLLVGLITKNTIPVFLVSIVANLLSWIVGGGFSNTKLYSHWLQTIVKLLPYKYGSDLFWYSYFSNGSPLPVESIMGASVLLLISVILLTTAAQVAFERSK